MASINFKVFGLIRPGFEPGGSRIEPTTFGFPDLPKREAGAVLNRTLTGHVGFVVVVEELLEFTSWQHLKAYQEGYLLVTMYAHGDFIVLPYWETRPPAQ